MQYRYTAVVPAYNVENYIEECLRSLFSQGRSDLEIIVVNDGSTDSTPVLVQEMCNELAGVRVVHQPNAGLLAARRAGYRLAQGDYILSVDGDDALLPGAIDAIDAALKAVDADCVLFGFTRRRGAHLDSAPISSCAARVIERRSVIELLTTTRRINAIWSKCVRRTCMALDVDYGGYGRLQNGEDLIQSLDIVQRSKTFACIDAPLYYYRDNPFSITRSFREQDIQDIEIARCAVHDFLARERLDGAFAQGAFRADFMQILDVSQSLCCARIDPMDRGRLLERLRDSSVSVEALDNLGGFHRLRVDYWLLALLFTARRFGSFRYVSVLRDMMMRAARRVKFR